MSLAIRLMPETVRSVAFGVIGNVYMGLGTAMTRPIRIIVLQNLTDEGLMFSFNGVDDHLPLHSQSSLVLDITSNKTISQGFFIAEGARFYVKALVPGTFPTLGAAYLTTFYGVEV